MLPILSVSAAEGREGEAVVFRVTLSEPSLAPVTVQARAVFDGTAGSGSEDANARTDAFTITIPAGETVSFVRYQPSGVFGNDEFDENFTLQLSDPSGAVLAGEGPVLTATGVILDANGGQNLALFVSDPLLFETDTGGQQATFEIRLSQPFSQSITLDYATADGTALAGSDYVATSGSVTFAPGQTVASVSVDIIGDTVTEASETFSLVVTPTNAISNGVADAAGVAEILDDDTDSGLPILSVSAAEGREGEAVVFRVTLSEPSLAPVTVQARAVFDGTAGSGSEDANARTDAFTITIPAGETVSFVRYQPSGVFGNDEFDENFTLQLSDPSGAVLAGEGPVLTATGVILDANGGQNLALFVSDPLLFETDTGGQQATFEIRLSQPFSQSITLDYATADGTALAGSDYVATSGSVTFAPGQTVASVSVDIIGDTVTETSETFSLVVTPTNAISNGVADAAGVAEILDDDTDSGLPILSVSAAEGREGEAVVFRVTLSEPSLAPVTVQARAVFDGTAGSGSEDANARTDAFTITIPAGETVSFVRYQPSGVFGNDEFDENFTLQLSDPSGAVLAGEGPVLTATGVILDANGGQNLALFVSDPLLFETDTGGQQATFEIRLSQPFSQSITLDYATADGTALAGSDYVATSGSVTFAPGQTVASVSVDIIGDTVTETSETFSLVVTPTNAISNGVADAAGVAEILDDDTDSGLPILSVSAAEGREGEAVVFRVTLSEPSLAPVTVQARAVFDGTAGSGSEDANARTDAFTITIPAGETVSFVRYQPSGVFGNDEFDENFTLQLSDPSGAVLAGEGPVLTATGVILDANGGQNLALFVSDPLLFETDTGGQQATFEIRLSQPFSQSITLDYATADGTALAGSDYVATSGSVTFAPGQTVASVSVDIIGDTVTETSETFSLVVTPTNAISNGVADAAGVAEILDDDTDSGLPILSVSAAEGREGEAVVFRVTLSEPSLAPVTVQARAVFDGTAGSGSEDANARTDAFTITIPAGETVSFVRYQPSGVFGNDEFDENFTLQLSDPSGAVLAGEGPVLTATGVILDANGGQNLALFVSDPLLFETDTGGQQATFEIRLSQPFSQSITLDYATADGTALAGSDYVATSGSVTFAPGQTVASVSVDIIGDTVTEASETFSLVVSDVPAFIADGDSAGVATIQDRSPITGTNGNDVLTGNDYPDIINGLGGNDRIDGLEGNDLLNGGDGADTIIGGEGNDSLIGGTSESDLRDVVFGGSGDDTIDGGYGNDELRGDSGNDNLAGGFGADTVIGGTGDDVLTGSAFGDLLFGGDGIDFVNGGFGSDRVNGGAGGDRFFHLGIADHGNDWIQDYNAAEGDVLVYGGSATRDQFQVNVTNTANAGADAVDEAFVIFRPTGQILWALVDGDGQNEINILIGGQEFDLLV